MWQCEKCREYKQNKETLCDCKEYKVTNEDDETCVRWGFNCKEVALKYARESNLAGDLYLLDGGVEITITTAEGKKEVFFISAEAEIFYAADPVLVHPTKEN